MSFTTNTCCRICGSNNLHEFLDLGPQPPANAFLECDQLESEQYFPLKVYFCEMCGLVQLRDVINPDVLFKDYAYFTGKSSETMKKHFKNLAEKITGMCKLQPEDLVIDIGSNDGTFLKNFDCRVIGIDPAENVAKTANLQGIKTYPVYFNAENAWKTLQKTGKAQVITATNVFAHVNNLYDFMAGVRCLLDDEGIFIIEVPHFMEQYKRLSFDQFYHEHLSYFLTEPLRDIGKKFGLTLFDIEKIPVHGGSIRCYYSYVEEDESSFEELWYEEDDMYLYSVKTYEDFGKRVQVMSGKLRKLLIDLKNSGNRIVGYGAPAKGNTLLNYCRIGNDILDYLTDTTPYKQGKLSPGMHIPVVSPEFFHEDNPDYALMLPWNYKEEILEKEKEFVKNGGRFIIPIPEPTIVP